MTPRQRALAASSPTIGLLLVALAWNAWEYRRPLIDRLEGTAIRICSRRPGT